MSAVCCNCTVLSQEVLTRDIRLLKVEWPDETHEPHAGQFYMVRAWGSDEQPFLSRPISVHCYDGGVLEFMYQIKGLGTQKMSRLAAGDTVQLTGPAGNGFDVKMFDGKKVAVVGGGIGTAPLYQVCRELNDAGNRPDFYCGFRDEVYGVEEFQAVCDRVSVATDTGSYGHHGFVTDLFDAEDYDVVLTCGPEIMMKNVAKMCKEANVPCMVSLEKKMACGIGACLGCTCYTENGVKSVCKHGPVFNAEEVF